MNFKEFVWAIVLGTRPEIIKLSPLIRLLQRKKHPFFVIHTGQHYSYKMDHIFFKDLKLPKPRYHLKLASRAGTGHGDHVGRMLQSLEPILLREKPALVLVQGDTNTVAATAIAVSKISHSQLVHVEAGLRSYDRQMPEEINRILTDHVSDYLLAPTPEARTILLKEGIPSHKITVTGNTIVDAVLQNIQTAHKLKSAQAIIDRYPKGFFLMTLHRQENVDHKRTLISILNGTHLILKKFKKPILFFAHPRTINRMKRFGLKTPESMVVMPPVGFLDFLRLEQHAELLLTDSGGVQEEAVILKVPCVTLRTSTERPETVAVGANLVAGTGAQSIFNAAKRMLQKRRRWANPLGDGHASERIWEVLRQP